MKRLLCALMCLSVLLMGCTAKPVSEEVSDYLLIDAGHGGFDGGAVAPDGTCEKQINLDIALHLRDMLSVCGVTTLMTRETDTALADTKSGDMQRRLALYEGSAAVIAIHQNTFSIPRYSGTQTFYSPSNASGIELAESVQRSVVRHLQADNHRPVKSISDGVFLMQNTTVPAVLVECGFLSNSEELTKLKDTDYQRKMAWSIALGYWDYLREK